ncbi:TPA: Heme peroxidase, partial [Pseudomonas aeruginosa]
AEMRRQQEEMQRQREELARQQQELAAARQQLAEQDTPVAVEPEAPKAEVAPAPAQIKPAGKAAEPSATQWRARVVDKTAFIAAIAEGLATEDLLVVDQPALDSLANSKGQTLNLPGVIVEKSPAKAA